MLCDTTGMVHNFEIYAGKMLPAVGFPDLGASTNIAFRLVSVVKPNVNHIVCSDNWFTSLPLVAKLAKRSIFTLGTLRSNRASGCSFSTEVDIRKRGRGTFEKKSTSVDGVNVQIVKWYDNRTFSLQIYVAVYNPYHLWNGGTGQKNNSFPSTVQQSLICTIIRW